MSTDPRERPILMSGPLVREILADRKTQTRRPVKDLRVRLRHEVQSDLPSIMKPVTKLRPRIYPAEMNQLGAVCARTPEGELLGLRPGEFDFQCPYAEGHTYLRVHSDGSQIWHLQVLEEQRLWVRETWADGRHIYPFDPVFFRADVHPFDGTEELCRKEDPNFRWRPSIHLPRRHARLLLEVKEVRVERLQAITEEDARAEGVADRAAFAAKWDEIYGAGAWRENGWVWAITVRRINP